MNVRIFSLSESYKQIAVKFQACAMLMIPAMISTAQSKQEKPNILFIMTDQQYAGMMSCTGNQYLNTPALDHLASSGIRFELAYSPNPVCCPSRTSMMTGYFPSTFGFSNNGDARDASIPNKVLNNTMGKLMQRAGYHCVYGGKTHWAKGLDMKSCGFEDLTRDEREELAGTCARFIRSKPKEPFFMVASFINPHDICYVEIDATSQHYGLPMLSPNAKVEREKIAEAVLLAKKAREEGVYDSLCPPLKKNHEITANTPEVMLSKYFPKPEEGEAKEGVYYYMNGYVSTEWTEDDWRLHHWIYHRLTEDVDRQIGTVLNALRETGLDKNTIIVFTSDHGDMSGSHKMVHKSHFYEEASRVPFIIAGPGVVKGVDNEHLISASVDLIPTFCDFAGINIPAGLQGLSIKPLAQGKSPANWRDFVISENDLGRMVRTARYKYSVYKKGEPREMLIDMQKDPGEMINLAVDPDYNDILKRHRAILNSWVKKTGDPIASKYLIL